MRVQRPLNGAVRPGQVVLSLAGRDAGRVMAVLEVQEGGFALVADGRMRTLAHPKRKRTKHLRAIGPVLEEAFVTDRRLRGALRAFAAAYREADQQVAADSCRRV